MSLGAWAPVVRMELGGMVSFGVDGLNYLFSLVATQNFC